MILTTRPPRRAAGLACALASVALAAPAAAEAHAAAPSSAAPARTPAAPSASHARSVATRAAAPAAPSSARVRARLAGARAAALVPPLLLPAASAGAPARAAQAGGAPPAPPTWIVGATGDAASARIARAHGARAIGTLGTWVVRRERARSLATALRHSGRLLFAEPDARRRASALDVDPGGWSRGAIVSPATIWPTPPTAPELGIIDQEVDVTHPDLAGHVRELNPRPVEGPHGTMVTSIASGSQNAFGVLGTFPGARVAAYALPPAGFGCSESAAAISAQRAAGVAVINMSYGSTSPCFAEYRELQFALAQGIVAIAAAGNEFLQGNPASYPAALPHVVSVASVDTARRSSFFSTSNAAVDVSAPGEDVPVAVPPALDADGAPDGMTTATGTSFAAPAVAGAALWVKAARPQLDATQVADVLRRSAVDVGPRGWDRDTGFGIVNVDRALVQPAPRPEPFEPNDDVTWVDGTSLGRRAADLWGGGRPVALRASVDQVEDPVDVYAIRVPARRSARIVLRPSSGDPDLSVYSARARTVLRRARRVALSNRSGRRTDAVTVPNRSGRAARFYIAVDIDETIEELVAGYRLSVRRAG
jgi:hypothetical protein